MTARRRATKTNAAYERRPDAESVVVRLPSPVSVNELYSRRAGGMVRLSDRYAKWLDEAGWRLSAQRPGRIAGRYCLSLGLPRHSAIDLDNGIKATSDLLQMHGVIRNDREAEEINLYRQDETDEAIVEVRPWSAAE